jgi:hypothetical protein
VFALTPECTRVQWNTSNVSSRDFTRIRDGGSGDCIIGECERVEFQRRQASVLQINYFPQLNTRCSMKRPLLLTAVVLFLTIPFVASSQSYFEDGKSYVGPSVGLSFLGSALQFGANYEYGMKTEFGMIGVGGVLRYWGYSEDFGYGSYSYTNILIGAQGNYHFKMKPGSKLDPWAGIILGYDASSAKWTGGSTFFGFEPSASSSGGLVLNAQGGARYWFSPTMAVRASIGYGSLSYGALDLGIDFKF